MIMFFSNPEPFDITASFVMRYGMINNLVEALDWNDMPETQKNVLHIFINICLIISRLFKK